VVCQCAALLCGPETAESQYAQAEEHSNKLKQLLMKTKKDLADAKKLVREFTVAICNSYIWAEAYFYVCMSEISRRGFDCIISDSI